MKENFMNKPLGSNPLFNGGPLIINDVRWGKLVVQIWRKRKLSCLTRLNVRLPPGKGQL